MAIHASGVLVAAGTSNAAGGTTTSGTISNAAALGAIVTGRVTNSVSSPSVACVATLNVSLDGTTFDMWDQETMGLAASAAYPVRFTVPAEAVNFNIVFSGNTGASVTVEARYQQLTAS